MSRNIEIKARVSDMAALTSRARSIATEGPVEISQDDTFFHCKNGRLKLRQFSADRGQLIFYKRQDQAGPKESFYLLNETSDPDTLRQTLEHAYGVHGQVTKQRTLYLVGRTRVHLDVVERLGDFMELEVVLTETDTVAEGEAEAMALMKRLEIKPADLIDCAYVDLLGLVGTKSTGNF
ncbi:MAG: class IV adenylate cyclase [Burkholderiaceae bacterium]